MRLCELESLYSGMKLSLWINNSAPAVLTKAASLPSSGMPFMLEV